MEKYTQEKEQDSDLIRISEKNLFVMLKEAYRNGYSTYEMVEAGLEPYDAEGYARWVIQKLK